MDATEFTEKGQGASLRFLHELLLRDGPLDNTARYARMQLWKTVGAQPRAPITDPVFDALTNIRVEPGLPLTLADFHRIARAEV